ncbi:hypothetical protein A3752_11225 [Oleiphilus sp. HI0081]|nr:hypothetical protein A3752_11225 [Oleiphilus sp. HI0081]
MDMGVEPFLISSSLVGIMAQRLVRVLCTSCRQPYEPDDSECEFLHIEHGPGQSKPPIYKAKGCPECNHLGYKGRIGIYELVQIDEQMRELIHSKAGELELETYARKCGPSIHDDGIQKVLAGVTTIEEVVRVTHRG